MSPGFWTWDTRSPPIILIGKARSVWIYDSIDHKFHGQIVTGCSHPIPICLQTVGMRYPPDDHQTIRVTPVAPPLFYPINVMTIFHIRSSPLSLLFSMTSFCSMMSIRLSIEFTFSRATPLCFRRSSLLPFLCFYVPWHAGHQHEGTMMSPVVPYMVIFHIAGLFGL